MDKKQQKIEELKKSKQELDNLFQELSAAMARFNSRVQNLVNSL